MAERIPAPHPPGTPIGESSIIVFRFPGDARPAWVPQSLSPGFHTLTDGAEQVRVFTRGLPAGGSVVVGQRTEVRDEQAWNSALRTLVPVLILLPVLVWLAARIVAAELAPVRRLGERLDEQPIDRVSAISDERVPGEIASFIHAINRLLERVNRLVGEQRRFIADAAHELRTPLAALLVQVQNVESAESLEEMRRRLVPLRGGIERARRLTEQLLKLARTQASSVELVEMDIERFLRELLAEYVPLANQRGIDLGMDAETDVISRSNPEMLRMILGNALDNALRYVPSGGTVTLRASKEGSEAVLEVIDNGNGLPASERARAFDAFHRIDPTREGSGLGLAIARDAAARLGGSVSLHDRESGHGLVFRYRQRRIE
jgi:two-component system OmpR family sensor kinase